MKRPTGILLIVLLALAMAGMQAAPAHAATTLTVSTCDESHLDSAVAQANSDNAGDTINFSCSGTITLTNTLHITGSMTIDGSGQSVVIDGNNAVQLVVVGSGISLALSHLTLQHGSGANAQGGAIFSAGTLTISNSTLSNNTATPDPSCNLAAEGGAIYSASSGTLSISNSTVSGNSAPDDWCGDGYNSGGAIWSAGTLTITSSTLSNNTAERGGAIWSTVTLTISNSTLSGNAATKFGGAMFYDGRSFNPGTVSITSSTLSGNSATYYGGAIYSLDGTESITSSTLSGNSASWGGAILSEGGVKSITSSTLSGNSASQGGAIYNWFGTESITSSTLSGNSASLGVSILSDGGPVQVGGSIIANSPSGGNCFTYTGDGGTIIDLGYNLEDDAGASCGFSSTKGDLVGKDPKLGPLANNGGPTQTMALQPTSPAIDQIPAGQAGCPTTPGTDQRGQSRPDGGERSCDMGAYEYQDPLVLALTVSPTTVQRGNPVTASVTLGNPTSSSQTVTGTVTLVYSGNSSMKLTQSYSLTLAAGQTLAKSVTFTVPKTFPTGTYTVTATAADSAGTATSSTSLTVT